MSARTTRRAFLGGAVAVAAAGAGGGAAKLAAARDGERHALRVPKLDTAADPPPFGTLLPVAVAQDGVGGDAVDRRTRRRVGRYAATDAGPARVHTLALARGTVVAVGDGRTLAVTGGTGRYARAGGTITVNQVARGGALDLDVELSL